MLLLSVFSTAYSQQYWQQNDKKQWQPILNENGASGNQQNTESSQQQQQQGGNNNSNGLGTLIGSIVNQGYDQQQQTAQQPQPTQPAPQQQQQQQQQPQKPNGQSQSLIQLPVYPGAIAVPQPHPVPIAVQVAHPVPIVPVPIAPFPIQQPGVSSLGEPIIENLIGGVPFDCRGKPTGHIRDHRFCDIFHACVFGSQRKTYACPFVGERTYFDEVTKRCEFYRHNPLGCALNAYYH